METNNLYPIFIKLDEIQTLIVGGGNVGLEKVNFILSQSPQAKIKIVAKEFHPQIIKIAIENRNVQLSEREFVGEDLIGIKLLILATNNKKVNFEIHQKAKENNILTNVVDNPPLCDFYTSAVLKKGPVKIAVSSNGVSPTLAKRLRDIINDVLPDEVENSAEVLNKVRNSIKGDLAKKIELLNRVSELLTVKNNFQESIISSDFEKINLN